MSLILLTFNPFNIQIEWGVESRLMVAPQAWGVWGAAAPRHSKLILYFTPSSSKRIDTNITNYVIIFKFVIRIP